MIYRVALVLAFVIVALYVARAALNREKPPRLNPNFGEMKDITPFVTVKG